MALRIRKNTDEMINSTKTNPDGSFETAVKFIGEFKKVEVDPKTGFNQHINVLGPTCYGAIASKPNIGVARTILVGLEVLICRGSEKETKTGFDAETALKQLDGIKEFIENRMEALNTEALEENKKKAEEMALRVGIRLNFGDAKKIAKSGR